MLLPYYKAILLDELTALLLLQDSPGSESEKNGTRCEGVSEQPDLSNENARLVARLATMQQEKWRLEERVLHLEEANAAMCDDLVNRGKLIQHYCMEGRRANPPGKQGNLISNSLSTVWRDSR